MDEHTRDKFHELLADGAAVLVRAVGMIPPDAPEERAKAIAVILNQINVEVVNFLTTTTSSTSTSTEH